MTTEFSLLGDVEARVDGRVVELGHARQRCVLVVLLIDANRTVSTDRLVDRVWGERAPHRVLDTLYGYLYRLRRALAAAGDVRIMRQAGGYVLRVDPMAVDVHRFHRLIGQAGETDDHRVRRAVLDRARGLWRGEAFAGLDSPWLHEVRGSLDRELFAAELDHTDLRLRDGQHTELVPELTRRVAEHRLDERVVGQLMLAQFRCGRQGDALDLYEQTRVILADQLGTVPNPGLRQLHLRILRGDTELTAHAGATSPNGPNQLPGDIADFTGREVEMSRLLAALPADGDAETAVVIGAIGGMAGVGKTALAVHAAHRLTDRYPDAQLFIDLHGHSPDQNVTDPMAALATLLRALGVPGQRIPLDLAARADLWRAELAGRRAVVVLDNAVGAAQVRPLLPGHRGCLVMITSRNQLADLDCARSVHLDVLPPSDAAALFVRIVADKRTEDEPDSVAEIAQLCGYLPLAIRIAAARLCARPAWTVGHLAGRLRDQHRLLGELAVGERSVAASFNLSYQDLTAEQRDLFRRLGLHPGPDFDAYLAAAIADIDVDKAERLLEELLDVHLVAQSRTGRYHFHDLVRAYAARLALDTDTEASRRTTLTRVFDHYRHTASVAMSAVAPHEKYLRPRVPATNSPIPDVSTYDRAMTWLDTERPNLLTATATDGWPTHACQLSTTLWRYLDIRGRYEDAQTLAHQAIAAARASGDRTLEAQTLLSQGFFHWRQGRTADAHNLLERALTLSRDLGGGPLECAALYFLGIVYERKACYEQAMTHIQLALDIARAGGIQVLEARALCGISLVHQRMGRYTDALAFAERALALSHEIDDRGIAGLALYRIGLLNERKGRDEQALTNLRQAIALARTTADQALEYFALWGFGVVYERTGRYRQALTHYEQSRSMAHKANDRAVESYALRGLGSVCERMGRHAEALTHCERALVLTRGVGDRAVESSTLTSLGAIASATGDQTLAIGHYHQALDTADDIGDPDLQADAHNRLAHALHDSDPDAAGEHWQRALAIYTALGVREAEDVRRQLTGVRSAG